MAFSGGVFSRIYDWTVDAAAGIKIRADRMDEEMDGIATGLSTCVTKDGQTTITAALPMGGFNHTGVGNATARTQYASMAQVQDQGGVYVATVAGTADAITLTPSPAITAYAAGQRFAFIASGANTTNVTIATSGLATRAVTKEGSIALVAGDIVSGALVIVQDDGTRYQLVSVGGVATKQGANTFTGAQTFSSTVALNGPLAFGTVSELTIASGSITPTTNTHIVDTESDGATDDLTDIDDANMPANARLLLRAANDGRTVVVKNDTGNHKIHTADAADFSLDDDDKSIQLELRSGEWYEIARSGGLAVATQADMETATSLTTSVTPGRAHFHPGMAKVWCCFTWSAGTPTVGTSYNLTSLTDEGAGVVTFVFATDFSSANYAWGAAGTDSTFVSFPNSNTANAAGSKEVTFVRASNLTATDLSGECSFWAFGDQA